MPLSMTHSFIACFVFLSDPGKVICTHCPALSATPICKGSAPRHSKIHTGKGRYHCSICGMGDVQSHNVKMHMRSRHTWADMHVEMRRHLTKEGIARHVYGKEEVRQTYFFDYFLLLLRAIPAYTAQCC